MKISLGGQDQFKAGDIQKFISGFQVLNSDLVICNLEKGVQVNMELTIEKGRGYVTAEENKKIELIENAKKTELYKNVLEKFEDANLIEINSKKEEN